MPRESAISSEINPIGSTRLRPPPDLTGPERDLFCEVVSACSPDHFRSSDLTVLGAFCRAAIMEKVAAGELAAGGYVIDNKPSAWASILKDAQRAVAVYSRLLRLNPVGRNPAKSEPDQPVSYYDRMRLEEAKRDEQH